MSIDPLLIREAVERGDASAVRDLLRDATEADRKRCAKDLRSFLHPDFEPPELITFSPDRLPVGPAGLAESLTGLIGKLIAQAQQEGPPREKDRHITSSAAFVAAGLGLAGSGKAARDISHDVFIHAWRLTDEELDIIAGVLADRRPAWLTDLVTRNFGSGLLSWQFARRLVRSGAIARPDIPQYTTMMPHALYRRTWGLPGEPVRVVRTPLDALRADPGLLEEEVWRLFTMPDAAFELAKGDGLWEEALATLAAEGSLDRARLLDACLDAFSRDFAPTRVAWYARMHDRLQPTLDEMTARAGAYLRLLGADSGPGVSVGQQGCAALLAARRLALADLFAASAPALVFPRKNVAVRQLKLIEKAADADPAGLGGALVTAAQAFGHSRLDVQEAALALIAKYGPPEDPDQRTTIAALTAGLDPALQREASALGLVAVSPAVSPALFTTVSSAGPAAGSPVAPALVDGPAIAVSRAAPVEDPAELIELLTRLMEDAADAFAVERAMAGAVRLCALPAAERRRLAAPLLHRAEEWTQADWWGPPGTNLRACMAELTLSWATGWRPDPAQWQDPPVRMSRILTARLREATALVGNGRAVELLASPDGNDGTVDPDRLLDRMVSWSDRPLLPYDLEIAMLRLSPLVDDGFWAAWEKAHRASLDAARRAHQAGLTPLSLTADISPPPIDMPNLNPGQVRDPVVLAQVATDPADGSRCWEMLTDMPQALRDYHRLNSTLVSSAVPADYDAVVAAWPLLCPWRPELAAAHLLRPLSYCLTAGASRTSAAAVAIRGLLLPGRPFGEIGHLALMTGLAAAEPYVRIAAAEAWATASRAGHLDPSLAAAALAAGVTGGAFKLTRIADALGYATQNANTGPGIARTALAAADTLLPARPANLHLLLDLAAQISGAMPLPEPPPSIRALASTRSSTRLAIAARRLCQP
jgi:hypothetical protein